MELRTIVEYDGHLWEFMKHKGDCFTDCDAHNKALCKDHACKLNNRAICWRYSTGRTQGYFKRLT